MKIIVKAALIVLLICSLSGGTYGVAQGGEGPGKSSKEKAVSAEPEKEKPKPAKSQPEKKATIRLIKGSGNKTGIELVNSVPVRGVQFTIKGVKMTEVRTTSRTEGFMVNFSEETGTVILVSTSADEIAPGKGLVLEVIGEKVPGTEVSLSHIILGDRNREKI